MTLVNPTTVAVAGEPRRGHRMSPVSVVVISRDEGDCLRRTVDRLQATLPPDGEIVVVDDASSDGSADFLDVAQPNQRLVRSAERLGCPSARNVGAEAARGEVLVFADAHVDPPTDWAERLVPLLECEDVAAVGPAIAVMGNPTARGYGITWSDSALNVRWLGRRGRDPYPVPMLGAAFLLVRRDAFEAIGGWDGGIVHYGGADAELGARLWTFGYRCVVHPEVAVAHKFGKDSTDAGGPVSSAVVLHNLLRIATVHFGERRLASVVRTLQANSAFPAAAARVLASDCWVRRDEVRARRVHDDDWYCGRFQFGGLS